MAKDQKKYDLILDALQQLLRERSVQTISVSDIAQAAGIGKGSIYYYFPSKDAIVEALVQRNYEAPLKTAKSLSARQDIPPFTRMAMIFQACRSSSTEYSKSEASTGDGAGAQEKAFLHQTYMNHLTRAQAGAGRAPPPRHPGPGRSTLTIPTSWLRWCLSSSL